MPNLCESCGARPGMRCPKCETRMELCFKCGINKPNKCNGICSPEVKQEVVKSATREEFRRLSATVAEMKALELRQANQESQTITNQVYESQLNELDQSNQSLKMLVKRLESDNKKKDEEIRNLKNGSLRLNKSFIDLKTQMDAIEHSKAQDNVRIPAEEIKNHVDEIIESEKRIKSLVKEAENLNTEAKIEALTKGKRAPEPDMETTIAVKSAKSTLKQAKEKRATLKKTKPKVKKSA